MARAIELQPTHHFNMQPVFPTIEKYNLMAKVAISCCTMLETPSKLRTEALKIGQFAGFAGNMAVAANP